MTLFSHFSKTTAPQHLIFEGTLSTIIIFKRCKSSVILWTLCIVLQKVPKSFYRVGLLPAHFIKQYNKQYNRLLHLVALAGFTMNAFFYPH